MLKLYNTATKKLEEFTPQQANTVSLYTCGPTVYNDLTVGNWVAYIRWDTLVRILKLNNYNVSRVMNITDVGHLVSDADEGEDKIVKGAKREGITEREVAKRYTELFLNGMQQLNLLPPEHLIKATDHIDIQINLVKQLESKGFTYVIKDGVYFDTSKFSAYAEFAQLDLTAQKAGARVAVSEGKRQPSDFVLWRLTPVAEERAMEWSSPWGKGIPGWHIECSAMAIHYLGETIDIHTGGIDHIPVHHTNEIAQSEAATGKKFVNTWLHNNFLLVNGTKISKSLNNGYTLSDLAKKDLSPLDYRMFVLQSHYRSESNFTWENLTAAKQRLSNWRTIADLRWQTNDTIRRDVEKSTNAITADLYAAIKKVKDCLNDDLNTPEALMQLEALFNRLETVPLAAIQKSSLIELLQFIDDVFGLAIYSSSTDITDEQKKLLLERQRAREAKDWAASDQLRDKLVRQGIGMRDTTSGLVWFRT